MKPIRIGTRGSKLALWQAHWVEAELQRYNFVTKIVEIGTSGDHDRHQPIAELGVEGVFTKEIQRALLEGEIDLAVHSLKDLPTETVNGLEFVASPQRGPFRDAFVSNRAASLDELPDGSRIGTGSIRRKAQLLNLYRSRFQVVDLSGNSVINLYNTRFQIVDIRGNVETRLKKLDAGDYDAIILAEAGLVRLGLQERIMSFLEPPLFLPAIGQGALGIEIRSEDKENLASAIFRLNDPETFVAVTAERSLLRSLRGGCLAPIAAFCRVEQSTAPHLMLTARVLSPDGQRRLETSQARRVNFLKSNDIIRDTAARLGKEVADKLFASGAEKLLREE